MANFNRVILIGRLTRDPEARSFSTGGKVVSFGFAVSTRRKNPTTGAWEDGDPMFIDVKVFNRGDLGKKADLAEQTLRKGHLLFIEGHLVFEQWEDKTTGQKRSKHVVSCDTFEYLERRSDTGGGEGGYPSSASTTPARRASAPPPATNPGYGEDEGASAAPPDDIPF